MSLLIALWDKIRTSKWFLYIVAFVAGLAVCYFIYPTKTITEKVKQEYQSTLEQKVQEQKDITTQITKRLEEQTTKNTQMEAQYTSTVNQLNSKITEMSSSKVVTTHKVTRADGSSETWTYMESESKNTEKMLSEVQSDYEQKLKQSESDWQKKTDSEVAKTKESDSIKITELQKQVETLQSSTVTITNAKKFGLELGAKPSKRFYAHGTYDLFGPIFVGVQAEQAESYMDYVGVGLGVRF